jgi:hypothetical protein
LDALQAQVEHVQGTCQEVCVSLACIGLSDSRLVDLLHEKTLSGSASIGHQL